MPGRHGCITSPFSSHIFPFSCLILSWLSSISAQPATIPFTDCFSGNTSLKLNVSNVYAQVFELPSQQAILNLTLLGQNPQDIVAASNGSDPVATTLFTTTELLTFPVWTYNSYFCSTLRPPSPLPTPNDQGNYCPLPAGPFALSSSIGLGNGYELATFYTRLRALDPFQNELLCLDVNTTPLRPGSVENSPYGRAHIIFWATVCLAIAYWVVVGSARLVSAWGRGSTRTSSGLWARAESAGYILASAISGERFATSPALLRFCTPSLRDIIFHTQWCAALSMVAVQWPDFTYPLLSQTAWATLSYNITLTQGSNSSHHWDPLSIQPYNPPDNFADQLNDVTSPLYLNSTAPNFLFQLPPNTTTGIPSFAFAVGVRPQDLFGICLSLFLSIIAAAIVISLAIWVVGWIASRAFGGNTTNHPPAAIGPGSRSPRFSAGSKDMLDSIAQLQATGEENRTGNGHFLFRTTSRFASSGRPWWRLQSSFVSLHSSVLQGNLVRILIFFHLPITIFSCYQLTLGRPHAGIASIITAGFAFAILSILFPILLIFRLWITNTTKLYDETWTLLFLGPLYNHYRHGSQLFACLLFATNLAFGITIGCGQKSGTAQAIIILVVEVMSALGTSLWLPWGQGASMGLISFLFCVARIVIAVLLVILSPIVSVGAGAGQWVAYAILFILGLIYLAFALLLVVKIIEALVRIFGGIGFHQSRHVVDSGLLGALGLLGCCGSRKPAQTRGAYYQPDERQPSSLPLSRPLPPYKDATPTHSAPPSVLRPEHALQPYKEESDDETGFIMGAWQPFPRPGYSPVDDHASTSSPVPPPLEPPKSGFARVGGGRAHYDSPYAIASGSTQTFPSVERKGTGNTSTSFDYSPPPTPSVASAPRRADFTLPPGAMPPAHVRTKSQTAVIENVPAPVPMVYSTPPSPTTPRHTQSTSFPGSTLYADIGVHGGGLGTDDPSNQPTKKKWYDIRKVRKSGASESALDTLSPSPGGELSPEAEGGANTGSGGGRSFVVVRKHRPGTGNSKGSDSSAQGGGGEGSSASQGQERSFTVLRGPHRESLP